MATAVSYQTGDGRGDGVLLELVVGDDVAEVLAEPEPRLRAVVFTDLAKPRATDDGPTPDRADLADTTRTKRHNGRGMAKVGCFEGPRLRFNLIIGTGPIWNGPPKRFEFCGGRQLGRGEYCCDCDRCGRELEIVGPGHQKPKALALILPDLAGGTDAPRRKAKGKRRAKAEPAPYRGLDDVRARLGLPPKRKPGRKARGGR